MVNIEHIRNTSAIPLNHWAITRTLEGEKEIYVSGESHAKSSQV